MGLEEELELVAEHQQTGLEVWEVLASTVKTVPGLYGDTLQFTEAARQHLFLLTKHPQVMYEIFASDEYGQVRLRQTLQRLGDDDLCVLFVDSLVRALMALLIRALDTPWGGSMGHRLDVALTALASLAVYAVTDVCDHAHALAVPSYTCLEAFGCREENLFREWSPMRAAWCSAVLVGIQVREQHLLEDAEASQRPTRRLRRFG